MKKVFLFLILSLSAVCQTPRMTTETLRLSGGISAQTRQITYFLNKTPAPNTYLLVIFDSSKIGQGKLEIQVVSTTRPKEVVLTLPMYRPFNGDLVKFVYWTNE